MNRQSVSTTDVEMLGEGTPITKTVELKLEAVVIPVSNVERSRAFCGSLGWRLDADFDNGFGVVQFTPSGSGASISSARWAHNAAPGSIIVNGNKVVEGRIEKTLARSLH